MADILATLGALEQEEKKKKAANSKKTPSQSLAEATRQNARRSSRAPNRPQSQPVSRAPSRSGAVTPTQSETYLTPNNSPRVTRSASAAATNGTRAQSVGADSRRISFVDLPRAPPTRVQVKIPTKNDTLSSGFTYDGQKLIKYEVSAKEWNHFSGEVVLACDAHHYNALTWPISRNKVIKKVRNDLRYGNGPDPGEVSKIFKKWNKLFRRQGFQAWLELPSEEGAEELGRSTAGMSKDEQKQAIKEAKRFRIVISPLDTKGGSIYSKSSIRNSVSKEGSNFVKRAGTNLSAILQKSGDTAAVKEVDTQEEAEDEKEEALDKTEEQEDSAKPVEADTPAESGYFPTVPEFKVNNATYKSEGSPTVPQVRFRSPVVETIVDGTDNRPLTRGRKRKRGT